MVSARNARVRLGRTYDAKVVGDIGLAHLRLMQCMYSDFDGVITGLGRRAQILSLGFPTTGLAAAFRTRPNGRGGLGTRLWSRRGNAPHERRQKKCQTIRSLRNTLTRSSVGAINAQGDLGGWGGGGGLVIIGQEAVHESRRVDLVEAHGSNRSLRHSASLITDKR